MNEYNTIKNGVNAINKCYTIAEAGNNHNGNIDIAFRLIDVAIDAGCSAVKFQKRHMASTWTNEELNKPMALWNNSPKEWGNTYGKIRESIEMSIEKYSELREYCRGKIDFGISPFDFISLEQCKTLDVDFYKVAGFTMTHLPLLKEIARINKPIIVSCGICTNTEIEDMLDALSSASDIVLMHCVSSYPMAVEDANLCLIEMLKQYGHPVGFSDHSTGISLAPVARALGAIFQEKHYTIDRSLPGSDHIFCRFNFKRSI